MLSLALTALVTLSQTTSIDPVVAQGLELRRRHVAGAVSDVPECFTLDPGACAAWNEFLIASEGQPGEKRILVYSTPYLTELLGRAYARSSNELVSTDQHATIWARWQDALERRD